MSTPRQSRHHVVIPQYLHEPGLGMAREVADVTYWPEDSPMPREQLLAAVEAADGILTHPASRYDRELLDRAPRLRVISNIAVGWRRWRTGSRGRTARSSRR